jgi:O-antigen/teichoic acid export membrane protein
MRIFSTKYLVLADQALFSGLSFVTTIWIARNVDAISFGIYSAWILAIYLFVSAIGAWIIQPFQIRYNKIEQQKEYLALVFWGQFATTFVAVALIFFFNYLFDYQAIGMILCYGAGFIFYDFFRKTLLAMNRIWTALVLNIFTSILTLVGLAYLTWNHIFSIENFLQFSSIIYFSIFIVALIYFKPFPQNITDFNTHFTYHMLQGKWFFMTAISQWWAGNLFVVASGVYLGPKALGALRLAQSLFGILNVILQTFENYVLPQTASRMHISIPEGIHYLKNLSVKAAWLFLPLLMVSFFFARDLLVLAGGKQFAEYYYVVQGLSILYVLIYLSQPLRCLIRSLEFNEAFFKGYLLTLAFALLFSHLILSNFGLYGVLSGLIISQIILIAYWSLILHSKKIQIWKSFISY